MIVLFPKEQLLLEAVMKKNPAQGALLAEAVNKIYVHLPEKLLDEKYDAKIVQEFLIELVKDGRKLGLEKYESIVVEDETKHALKEKCLANGALLDCIFKSLGSYGLTKVLQAVLQKMASAQFNKKEIDNLVALVEARNKMRQNEEKFLKDAFRAYLRKQISLYE